MHPARIAELLEPFLGPEDQRPKIQDRIPGISTYIDILQHWNARVNLTAIRDPEEIVTRHFGESLFAARHLFPNDRGRAALQGRVMKVDNAGALAPVQITLADVGSGAGFPGIPIKLWAPGISMTLIESSHKKSVFLREIVRALTLTDINIQTARAETLPPASFDVVTLRAVERFTQVLPVAASLATPGGRLALLLGADQLPEVRRLLPGHTLFEPLSIPLSRSRVLLTASL